MANEELNVNRDWAINVNLSGLVAPSGNKNMDVPEGYYKATISDMYINAERNPNRVIIKLTINDMPFTGVVRTDGLGVPKDDSDKVRYYWRALAESAGYTPAQLDKGAISLGLDTFKDRVVHVHYTPKGTNGSEYDRTEYLSPADWSQGKQVFDMKAGKTASAPAPATNGANTTTKNDVLSKLGL